MPVAFEAISNTTYASRTNTVVTAAALGSIANDDLLLAFVLTGANPTPPAVTPPAGFSQIPGATWPMTVTQGGGNTFTISAVGYYKFASGESGDYTFTHASGSSQGVMLRVSGADTSSPFTPAPSQNEKEGGVSGEDTVFTGLTTATDESLIVAYAFDWGDTTVNLTPPTGTTPTFTERLDTAITYVATGVLAAAGATGDKTMANNSSTVHPWVASLVAVEPRTAAVPISYTAARMIARAY